jgi:hypothetical protein
MEETRARASQDDDNGDGHVAPMATDTATTDATGKALPLWTRPNPLADPARLIPEGHRLSRVIAAIEGCTPASVIAEASKWRGRSQRLHVMTPDRLSHTLCNLWAWERRVTGKPEPMRPEPS